MSGTNGGRGAPVSQGRRGSRFSRNQKIGAWCLAAGAIVAFNFYRNPVTPDEPIAPSTQTAIRPAANFSFIRDEPPARLEPPARTEPPVSRPQPPDAGLGSLGSEAKADTRMLSYSVRPQVAAAPPVNTPSAPTAPQAPGAPAQPGAAPTTVAFVGAPMAGRRAGPAIDTTLTLMPGIYGCVLDVAVNSERPGPFFCHTTKAVKSPVGAVLMEAGTNIVGNYQSDVRQGQGRIVSLAAVAWTPRGVPVPLGNAPVGDALGRGGMDGRVDTHMGARLGSAVILMMTQGAFSMGQAALQASLSRGGGNSYLNLNSGGVESSVGEALRGGSAIQNTVTKNQGEEIAFMLTEPISFQDAYLLEPR